MSRIGVDLRIVHYARTGFHRYARGLVQALARERARTSDTEIVLLTHPDDSFFGGLVPELRRVAISTPVFDEREATGVRRETAALGLDVVHFPFSLFPGPVSAHSVLTIHDVTCLEHPDAIEDRYRPHYLDAVRRAGEADLVLADSDRVRAALVAAGAPADRVRTCPPWTPFEGETFDAETFDAGAGDPAPADLHATPYLLSVGSLEPRKDLATLVAAFDAVRARHRRPLRLVLAGHHGWKSEPLLARIDASPHRDDIVVLRAADDRTVRALLRACTLFVCCSLHEGFGLPVLEALAERACVVSTPVPSLVEAGFPAEGLVPPGSVDALAARLTRLLDDDEARRRLAAEAAERVGAFYRALDPARLAVSIPIGERRRA